MNVELIAGAAGLSVFLLGLAVLFNRLVRARYRVRAAWSDIDVQLKKRYELVPNLVELVRGYAAHESQTLEAVIERRTAAMTVEPIALKAGAEQRLSDGLNVVLGLAESYPLLRADQGFQDLMGQLRDLEDDIEYARRYYNASVRDYNIATETFPSGIVAAAFSFERAQFFALRDPGVEGKAVLISIDGAVRS